MGVQTPSHARPQRHGGGQGPALRAWGADSPLQGHWGTWTQGSDRKRCPASGGGQLEGTQWCLVGGGCPSVHRPARSCPAPGLDYWASWAVGPEEAPFFGGILDMWKKRILMAWWQVSRSLGTSATVRPRVGMASSTSTWMVPVGAGWGPQPPAGSHGGPLSPRLGRLTASRGPGLGWALPDTPVSGNWLLIVNH